MHSVQSYRNWTPPPNLTSGTSFTVLFSATIAHSLSAFLSLSLRTFASGLFLTRTHARARTHTHTLTLTGKRYTLTYTPTLTGKRWDPVTNLQVFASKHHKTQPDYRTLSQVSPYSTHIHAFLCHAAKTVLAMLFVW